MNNLEELVSITSLELVKNEPPLFLPLSLLERKVVLLSRDQLLAFPLLDRQGQVNLLSKVTEME